MSFPHLADKGSYIFLFSTTIVVRILRLMMIVALGNCIDIDNGSGKVSGVADDGSNDGGGSRGADSASAVMTMMMVIMGLPELNPYFLSILYNNCHYSTTC